MAAKLRTVNLEQGMPQVNQAIRRLTFEIHHTRDMGVPVLKLIHGYGSTGAGGKIRVQARNYLARLKNKGEIRGFIPGESFSIFDEETRNAFTLCPDLRKDADLERHNNGITFVLLKP